MPPLILESDEEYVSSDDEDFKPTIDGDAAGEEGTSSESEEDAQTGDEETVRASKTRPASKPKPKSAPPPPDDDLDSGDEAIVRRGKKKNLRSDQRVESTSKSLVRTRAQRRLEGDVRSKPSGPGSSMGAVTIDVDALWVQMNEQGGTLPPPPSIPTAPETSAQALAEAGPGDPSPGDPNMILIERTINFAGQSSTEKKLVPRHSAEAQLYLSSRKLQNPSTRSSWPHSFPPERPLRKKSRFEPANLPPMPTSGETSRVSLRKVEVNAGKKKRDEGLKLNTVEKSKLDWAQYKDEKGLKEELEKSGRDKDAYLGRMDFLGRVNDREEGGRKK